jgi:hypothetical protein
VVGLGGVGGGVLDVVAQGLKLSGEVVGASCEVDAAGVEVGSEVGELGGGIGEQVKDDDQDGPLQRD